MTESKIDIEQANAQITQMLSQFPPITLQQMKEIRLMNRTDTKYVVPIATLVELLERAKEEYYVQETEGVRNIEYHTVYFDTPDKAMYYMHLHGKKTREKIRVRSYVKAGLSFFEIKNKSNRGRTNKLRIKVKDWRHIKEARAAEFMEQHADYSLNEVTPHIENSFQRITLVNKAMSERVTIDTNICFHNLENENRASLPGLAVIEVKRDGRSFSPIYMQLLKMHIHVESFSKYCMGCMMTNPELKRNRFKERLRRTMKIENGEVYARF